MDRRGTTLWTALLFAFLIAWSGGRTWAGTWMTDPAAARKESVRTNKPLLMHFHAEWCGPCRKMEGETLNSPEVLRQLGKDFIGVKVNTDHHEDLTKHFNVKSLPSDVIVAPDGRVLTHTIGFQEKGDYLGRLAHAGSRFRAQENTKIVSEGSATEQRPTGLVPVPTDDPASGASTKQRTASRPASTGDEEARFVGLNGYSPVALYQKRDWVKGKREFAATHEGVTYLFVSADELDTFEANPGKFAPRLIGCDPVVFAETQRALPGSTRFGAYFEGDLFLFVSSATRDQFKQEPEKYGKTREKIPVDQVEFRRSP